MSTWRKKAIEIAPELRKEFEDTECEIYSVFREFLSVLRESCKTNNVQRIQDIYNYAEWCFRQREKELWNAAGVAFYEHLGDTNETFSSITSWLKKDIYNDIRSLLQIRLQADKLKTLDKFYEWNE